MQNAEEESNSSSRNEDSQETSENEAHTDGDTGDITGSKLPVDYHLDENIDEKIDEVRTYVERLSETDWEDTQMLRDDYMVHLGVLMGLRYVWGVTDAAPPASADQLEHFIETYELLEEEFLQDE